MGVVIGAYIKYLGGRKSLAYNIYGYILICGALPVPVRLRASKFTRARGREVSKAKGAVVSSTA